MKNRALCSSKDKSKKLKCRLLQFLFGALRLKYESNHTMRIRLVLRSLGVPKLRHTEYISPKQKWTPCRAARVEIFFQLKLTSVMFLI